MSRAGLYETRTALAVVSGHINHQGRGPHRPPQPRQARLKARHRPTLRPPPAITPAWAASCLLARGQRRRPAEADDIPAYPACFPRFVQFVIWRLCSASELNVCNGNRIDDRGRCQNVSCPVFPDCDRVALRTELPA
jgi:hypothetical protein